TRSSDFPTTEGAYDDTYNGAGDLFVAMLSPLGDALSYSTYVGGSALERGYDIVMQTGYAYVAGGTRSSDFPTTPGAHDTMHNGGNDAFVLRLDGAGSGLMYSTFLGGAQDEQANSLTIGGSGSTYVTGHTASGDFPTTPGAYDTAFDGQA